jgi:hypothetical protein
MNFIYVADALTYKNDLTKCDTQIVAVTANFENAILSSLNWCLKENKMESDSERDSENSDSEIMNNDFIFSSNKNKNEFKMNIKKLENIIKKRIRIGKYVENEIVEFFILYEYKVKISKNKIF